MEDRVITTKQQWAAIAVSIIHLGSFAIVFVVAGHGVAPLGLILVTGKFSVWGFHLTLGWVAVLLTCVAMFCSGARRHFIFAACGLACVAVSWALFVTITESNGITLVTSIPLAIFSLFRAVQLSKL